MQFLLTTTFVGAAGVEAAGVASDGVAVIMIVENWIDVVVAVEVTVTVEPGRAVQLDKLDELEEPDRL